jgi:hypothetical protein
LTTVRARGVVTSRHAARLESIHSRAEVRVGTCIKTETGD